MEGAAWRPGLTAALVVYMAVLLGGSVRVMFWTPPVISSSGPAHLFSEARALNHVEAMSVKIGDRQVSTPGVQKAAAYLLQQCLALKKAAGLAGSFSVQVLIRLENARSDCAMQVLVSLPKCIFDDLAHSCICTSIGLQPQ